MQKQQQKQLRRKTRKKQLSSHLFIQKQKRNQTQKNNQKQEHQHCLPGDNYYLSVINRIKHEIPIPDTLSRISYASLIREQIDKELKRIIQSYKHKKHIIATLLQSWNNTAIKGKEKGYQSLSSILLLTATTTISTSAKIGWMIRHGIPTPLTFRVGGDPRDRHICRIVLDVANLRIGSPEFWSGPEYTKHRRMYSHYIQKLANNLGLPFLQEGYSVEKEFSAIYPSDITELKPDLLTYQELCSACPSIDWETLFREIGFNGKELLYQVPPGRFLIQLNKRFNDWSDRKWSAWLTLLVAQWYAGLSPPGPLRSAWFVYNKQFLLGIPRDYSLQDLESMIVQVLLPDQLSELWISEHRKEIEEDCNKVGEMIQKIRDAAIDCIEKTGWLSLSTKKSAIEKLRDMRIECGWIQNQKENEKLILNSDDYIGNILAIAEQACIRNLEQLDAGGCGLKKTTRWDYPAFTVNAFYFPHENRFILPAGILRPPFFDRTASDAINYGAIGATIGHELCHALDAEGRFYDKTGAVKHWWTPGDNADFLKIERKMKHLFDSVTYRGLPVDGSLTLEENIADLGGLEFALAALINLNSTNPRNYNTLLRDFFNSYAASWWTKERLQRTKQLLNTDPHAPPMHRVNQIVRQFDEWYSAFGVDERCASFIPLDARLHLFRSS